MKPKILVIGGSRGLGHEIAKSYLSQGCEVEVVSRTRPSLDVLHFARDLSVKADMDFLCRHIACENYDFIFYAAGGGPYGTFAQKKWTSHVWSIEVSFLSAMRILHTMLQRPTGHFVAIGSLIAAGNSDTNASSYAAAKSALANMLETIADEGAVERISLISPGYMDTAMLPSNAWPRQQGAGAILDPKVVAEKIVNWLLHRDGQWRLDLPSKVNKLSSETSPK